MLDVHCHDELFGDTMLKMKNLHQDGIISGISKEVQHSSPQGPTNREGVGKSRGEPVRSRLRVPPKGISSLAMTSIPS